MKDSSRRQFLKLEVLAAATGLPSSRRAPHCATL